MTDAVKEFNRIHSICDQCQSTPANCVCHTESVMYDLIDDGHTVMVLTAGAIANCNLAMLTVYPHGEASDFSVTLNSDELRDIAYILNHAADTLERVPTQAGITLS